MSESVPLVSVVCEHWSKNLGPKPATTVDKELRNAVNVNVKGS